MKKNTYVNFKLSQIPIFVITGPNHLASGTCLFIFCLGVWRTLFLQVEQQASGHAEQRRAHVRQANDVKMGLAASLPQCTHRTGGRGEQEWLLGSRERDWTNSTWIKGSRKKNRFHLDQLTKTCEPTPGLLHLPWIYQKFSTKRGQICHSDL